VRAMLQTSDAPYNLSPANALPLSGERRAHHHRNLSSCVIAARRLQRPLAGSPGPETSTSMNTSECSLNAPSSEFDSSTVHVGYLCDLAKASAARRAAVALRSSLVRYAAKALGARGPTSCRIQICFSCRVSSLVPIRWTSIATGAANARTSEANNKVVLGSSKPTRLSSPTQPYRRRSVQPRRQTPCSSTTVASPAMSTSFPRLLPDQISDRLNVVPSG
jgi:hypothetical protein